MISRRPIQGAVFCAGDVARGYLFYVDVGGIGRGGVVDVLGDGQGHGGHGDGSAQEPAYALLFFGGL